ncbi:hypothetical protein ACLIBG_03880 [Virgibacillus sp. W0181]|uniref:hypothetical protein n=1 Tax=Virgibacillus sp. W0181 TaxID=3391581 RepID=UPI003F45E1E7
MEEGQRKEVIIKEIKYWKAHNLLPRHYCDFLLALYTKGDYEVDELENNDNDKVEWLFLLQIFFLVIMIPISFSIIYFSALHFIWQVCMLILFLMAAYWSIVSYKKHSYKHYYNLAVFIFLCLIMMLCIKIINAFFLNQLFLYIVMFINLFSWLIIGYYKRSLFISVGGIIGAILLIVYIVY